jgi:hypothetical protein
MLAEGGLEFCNNWRHLILPLSHIADVGAIQHIKCILVLYAAIAHWSLPNHCSVNLSERSTSNIPRP